MPNYRAIAIATRYWRPGTDYVDEIVRSVNGRLDDGDFVVVSEKAISIASKNIVDESKVKPSLTAKVIAWFWMRMVWGYFLGPICKFRKGLLANIREYPFKEGSRHKQVALQNVGFLQSLMFGSEGGIDGSNLAYSYVSLPLGDADKIASKIRGHIRLRLQKDVLVIIADTDKTFSIRNFHFTHRKKTVKGIRCFGFAAYVIGRILELKRRATPVAVAGPKIPVEVALDIAELANRARGFGAGSTVWDMARRFKVGLTEVSWEMLETVKHKPIVVVKRQKVTLRGESD
ncbi:MAG: coenzyme F420-0:L-glutamate ligase [Candidatus Bathyarchaeia archaeon]